MMHGGSWDQMGWGGWIGMTLMLIFWIAVITLIVLAITRDGTRMSAPSVRGTARPDQSLVILRERLAQGEITPDEFEQMRQLLDAEPMLSRR